MTTGALRKGAAEREARREWRGERVGQACMAAFLAAALSGAFGGGLLGSAVARGDGDVSVEYERFTRRGRPQSLTVEVPAALAPGGRLQLRIAAPFLERVQRLEVSPPPLAEGSANGERWFEFAVAGGTERLRFRFESERAGLARGHLAVAQRRPVALSQLVYP
jgi:hypothetical protein